MSGLEVLGAVSAAVQIAASAQNIITLVLEVSNQLRKGPRRIQEQAHYLDSLFNLLTRLRDQKSLQKAHLQDHLIGLEEKVKALQTRLHSYLSSSAQGPFKRFCGAIASAKAEDKIISSLNALDRDQHLLLIHLTADSGEAIYRMAHKHQNADDMDGDLPIRLDGPSTKREPNTGKKYSPSKINEVKQADVEEPEASTDPNPARSAKRKEKEKAREDEESPVPAANAFNPAPAANIGDFTGNWYGGKRKIGRHNVVRSGNSMKYVGVAPKDTPSAFPPGQRHIYMRDEEIDEDNELIDGDSIECHGQALPMRTRATRERVTAESPSTSTATTSGGQLDDTREKPKGHRCRPC